MKDAFQVMQVDLRALNDEWEYTGTGKIAEADLNYQYFAHCRKISLRAQDIESKSYLEKAVTKMVSG
jgi:hypothetical protein